MSPNVAVSRLKVTAVSPDVISSTKRRGNSKWKQIPKEVAWPGLDPFWFEAAVIDGRSRLARTQLVDIPFPGGWLCSLRSGKGASALLADV